MPILVSKDNVTFKVSEQVARMFGIVDMMLETTLLEAGDGEPIPLSVNGATLEKVIEWAEEHKDDKLSEHPDADGRHEELTDWDVHFFKANEDFIFDVSAFVVL